MDPGLDFLQLSPIPPGLYVVLLRAVPPSTYLALKARLYTSRLPPGANMLLRLGAGTPTLEGLVVTFAADQAPRAGWVISTTLAALLLPPPPARFPGTSPSSTPTAEVLAGFPLRRDDW